MFTHKSLPLTFMTTCNNLLDKNPIFPQLEVHSHELPKIIFECLI